MTQNTAKDRIILGLALVGFFVFLTLLFYLSFKLIGWVQATCRAPRPHETAAQLTVPKQTTEVAVEPSNGAAPAQPPVTYIEVVDSCNYAYVGDCLNVRSGPSREYPVVARLRNDVVLKVGKEVTTENGDWYEVVFDEWLRYPERLRGTWYVAAEYVDGLHLVEPLIAEATSTAENKKELLVDRSEQMLYAYEDDELVMSFPISTGLLLTPTPRGTFTVFKKTPSRYMQGPLPGISSDTYDLPGVPWNLYFTEQGAVIHGAYWHQNFGSPYSHGCVNLSPEDARKVYDWANVGTTVVVRD
ncbi:L,D-transpeptidase family protein [Candidatus Kaiserbacteria bacterium]|nr:L,D-transpeptidase family protein [Candidatus Kaiserbacteria bacterium]MCB9811974.1 L,D-transpeptidase family protein [Candidatus Nomurabacteria bacterium]